MQKQNKRLILPELWRNGARFGGFSESEETKRKAKQFPFVLSFFNK